MSSAIYIHKFLINKVYASIKEFKLIYEFDSHQFNLSIMVNEFSFAEK